MVITFVSIDLITFGIIYFGPNVPCNQAPSQELEQKCLVESPAVKMSYKIIAIEQLSLVMGLWQGLTILMYALQLRVKTK